MMEYLWQNLALILAELLMDGRVLMPQKQLLRPKCMFFNNNISIIFGISTVESINNRVNFSHFNHRAKYLYREDGNVNN